MYNGGPDGVHIGRYCGDQTPSNLSSANSLWIKFNSDNSGTAAGFIAAYTLMHGAMDCDVQCCGILWCTGANPCIVWNCAEHQVQFIRQV